MEILQCLSIPGIPELCNNQNLMLMLQRNNRNNYDDNNYSRQGSPDLPGSSRHGARRNYGRSGHHDHLGRGRHIHEFERNDRESTHEGSHPWHHASGIGRWNPGPGTNSYGGNLYRIPQPSMEEEMERRRNEWGNEDYYYNPYNQEGSQEGYFGTEGRVSQHTVNPYDQYGYDTNRSGWDNEDIDDRQDRYTVTGHRQFPNNDRASRYNGNPERRDRGRRMNR